MKLASVLMLWLAMAATSEAAERAKFRVVDAEPAPGSENVIRDNRIEIDFSDNVKPVEVTVTDAKGRIVSLGNPSTEKNTVIVPMKAIERSGYICGPMTVKWKVRVAARVVSGQYDFKIRPHHGNVCDHVH